jgi:hypothetical protein
VQTSTKNAAAAIGLTIAIVLFGIAFALRQRSQQPRAIASAAAVSVAVADNGPSSRTQLATTITSNMHRTGVAITVVATGERNTTFQVTAIDCGPAVFESFVRGGDLVPMQQAGFVRFECVNPTTGETVSRPIATLVAAGLAAVGPRAGIARENDGQVAARIAALSGEELVGALWDLESRVGAPVTFAQLERNADRYTGTPAIFTGEVLEIQDVPDSTGSFLRVGLNYESTRVLAVFALAAPGDDVVRGRRVRVYGTLAGTFSYHSQAGWDITIPRINALAVVRDSVPRRAARPR